MEIIIQDTAELCSDLGARMIARVVQAKPRAVLGLATGKTPVQLYSKLVEWNHHRGLSFRHVRVFNLDEYVGLAPNHPSSYHTFLRRHLVDHVDIDASNVHVPNGAGVNLVVACADYERQIAEAGGIDLQILGIGRDGHIGFNEPSSSLGSRTRVKTLTEDTRQDNSGDFPDSEVPRHVITMGIGTIMESRICVLLAFGDAKAEAVAKAVEGPISSMLPASALQYHPDARILLDPAAAARLLQQQYYRWVYEHKPEWQRY